MTRRISVAERLADDTKNHRLADIVAQSDWSQLIVEQAALQYGYLYGEWSCNDLREILPDLGQGFLGAAVNSLRTAGIIEHTGRSVPSTQANTHAHRIAVWTLTVKGRAIAAKRAARIEQRRAA